MNEEKKTLLGELEDIVEEGDLEDDSDESEEEVFFVVKKKLRELVKEVAVEDEFNNIRISVKGSKRLQECIRYLSVILIFETLEILEKKNRKTIDPSSVDEALTKVLGNTDSLGLVIGELGLLMERLESYNRQTAISKSFDFVNSLTKNEQEGE